LFLSLTEIIMPNVLEPPKPAARPFRSAKIAESKRVAHALDHLCRTLAPGSRLPKHTELMTELGASERVVLRELDLLHRSGRIVRRSGAGTFVAERQNLEPQPAAQGVDRSTIVAITRPDNSFFSRCVDLLFRQAEMLKLSMVYRMVDPEKQTEFMLPGGSREPLGYVVMGSRLFPLGRQLQEAGRRVVAIGDTTSLEPQSLPTVHADNMQGAYLAAEHLISLGHRRIAYAMVDENYAVGPRWEGHHHAFREAEASGCCVGNSVITLDTVYDWEQNPALASAYFQSPGAPTGLCVWNDREAIRLLTVLLRAGIRIPEDVSLVGYDNLPESAQVSPQLTTIDQGVEQQLRLVLRMLSQENAPQSGQTVLVTPTLIPRGSSRAWKD